MLSLLLLLFAQRRWRAVMAIHPCTQMATRIYNQHSYLYRTGYMIGTGTLLGFCLTSCGLVWSHLLGSSGQLSDWQLRVGLWFEAWDFAELLVSRILVLQGYDYLVTSFPASSADASLFFGGARYERLKSLVSLLKYTQHLNNSAINTFVNSRSRTRLPLYLKSFFYVCVRLSRDFGHFSLVMFCVSLARTLLATLKPNSSIS